MRIKQFNLWALDQQSRLLTQELASHDTSQPRDENPDLERAQRANPRVKPDRLPLLQLGMLLLKAWASWRIRRIPWTCLRLAWGHSAVFWSARGIHHKVSVNALELVITNENDDGDGRVASAKRGIVRYRTAIAKLNPKSWNRAISDDNELEPIIAKQQ